MIGMPNAKCLWYYTFVCSTDMHNISLSTVCILAWILNILRWFYRYNVICYLISSSHTYPQRLHTHWRYRRQIQVHPRPKQEWGMEKTCHPLNYNSTITLWLHVLYSDDVGVMRVWWCDALLLSLPLKVCACVCLRLIPFFELRELVQPHRAVVTEKIHTNDTIIRSHTH